jgi:hypothetical protein
MRAAPLTDASLPSRSEERVPRRYQPARSLETRFPVWETKRQRACGATQVQMTRIVILFVALVALVAVTSFAEAACGDRGGPGYRGPDGKCVSWEALGRACGSPPSTRCTGEKIAPDADDAAGKGQGIQEQKKRQHELRAENKNGPMSGKPDRERYTRAAYQARLARTAMKRLISEPLGRISETMGTLRKEET